MSNPSAFLPRAPRFTVQTPLHYRQKGELAWHSGTTVNLSRSGLLFRAEGDLAVDTTLEMRILFPADITGDIPAHVVCFGPVVRREPPAPPDDRPGLAAAILHYRFTHD